MPGTGTRLHEDQEKAVESLAHFPGSTVFARHQFTRFRIANDLLFLRIPPDLSSGEHRDKAKVSRNRRAVSDFHGCDGRLTRFDAIQKVLLVIG